MVEKVKIIDSSSKEYFYQTVMIIFHPKNFPVSHQILLFPQIATQLTIFDRRQISPLFCCYLIFARKNPSRNGRSTAKKIVLTSLKRKKIPIQETLNLPTCVDSRTDKKNHRKKKLSCLTCHLITCSPMQRLRDSQGENKLKLANSQ